MELIKKYGAGCVGGDNMEEAFEKGTFEKKYFKLLQKCRPHKYKDVDMDEEFEKIQKEKKHHKVKYGLFSY